MIHFQRHQFQSRHRIAKLDMSIPQRIAYYPPGIIKDYKTKIKTSSRRRTVVSHPRINIRYPISEIYIDRDIRIENLI